MFYYICVLNVTKASFRNFNYILHAAFASEKETITNLNLPAGQVDLQTLPLDFRYITL